MSFGVQSEIHERKEERTAFDADGAGEDGGDFTDVLLQFRARQVYADAPAHGGDSQSAWVLGQGFDFGGVRKNA